MFRGLRKLTVRFFVRPGLEYHTRFKSVNHSSTMRISNLESLSLLSEPVYTPAIIDFLSLLGMQRLRKIGLGVELTKIAEAQRLSEVLSRLSVQDITLFSGSHATTTTHLYSNVMPHLRFDSLCVIDPVPDIVKHLHRLSKMLRLELRAHDLGIWAILDHISNTQTSAQDVSFDWNCAWHTFRWIRSAQVPCGLEHANEDLKTRLLSYSALLSRKGIRLRDGDGLTLMDYHRWV
jgi:hypothetical protein